MTLILDPSNSMDAAGYEGLRDIVGINSTDAQINENPLFLRAESFIVGVVPEAELPAGRTYTNRAKVIQALQFLAAYNFISGGGSTATFQTEGGTREVKSTTENIGPVSKRTEYANYGATSKSVTTHGVVERTKYLLNETYQILQELNPGFKPSVASASGKLTSHVLTTKSRADERSDCPSKYESYRS